MMYKRYNGYFLDDEVYYDATENCYISTREEDEREKEIAEILYQRHMDRLKGQEYKYCDNFDF